MLIDKTILVTGGCGFIGSHFIKLCLKKNYRVINLDALTYAAAPNTLDNIKNHKNYSFEEGKIQDATLVRRLLEYYQPSIVINFAAETHVDRSIDTPHQFIESNTIGAFVLLSESYSYFTKLSSSEKKLFKFLHISTDEVFGSCQDLPFTEEAPYRPSSPYSASKASADLIIKSYYHTYNFPIMITNCTNNYGPYQFPEKLIPHIIIKAIHNENLPLYGNGLQIRDWLHVEDHVEGILKVIENGKIGETYNISGPQNEISNLEVVKQICDILNILRPLQDKKKYQDMITYVSDRPGHDFRYSLDSTKIKSTLDWTPKITFEKGIQETIQWYLNNEQWWQKILLNGYKTDRKGLRQIL